MATTTLKAIIILTNTHKLITKFENMSYNQVIAAYSYN